MWVLSKRNKKNESDKLYLCSLVDQVTFVVTHFNDPRISSADLRDLLLQSISVLVQYKEYLAAFESNEAAVQRLPKALLSAFDQRSWIPVTNILLRLCRSSTFGSSKHGESSSSSAVFQVNGDLSFLFLVVIRMIFYLFLDTFSILSLFCKVPSDTFIVCFWPLHP